MRHSIAISMLVVGLLLSFFVSGQSIRINEVSSSNTIYFDKDNDTPDWIELYNYGSEPVDLGGMSISDKPTEPNKWIFPNITLEPDQYLTLWASGKDIRERPIYRTLITEGDTWKYLLPTDSLFLSWTSLGYDDASWSYGQSGFGYGDNDDATLIPTSSNAIFLRKEFTISNLDNVADIFLDIDYDDGFFAYINGNYVAHNNISEIHPEYNTLAAGDHEARMYQGLSPERYDLDDYESFVYEGKNVLAVQVHNSGGVSSDLSAIPFLTIKYKNETQEGFEPVAPVLFEQVFLHTNFKLASSGETLSLYSENGSLIDQVEIPELSADVSYGISSGSLTFFEEPTPGAANTESQFSGFVESEVQFSHPGGIVSSISVTLSGNENSEFIRYTLDGSIPDESSEIYLEPIHVEKNTVINAGIFKDGYLPSEIATRSYLVGVSHELPILSLVVEDELFFGEEKGIYADGLAMDTVFPYVNANYWKEVEIPVQLSFIDNSGDPQFNRSAGIKIFGNYSRVFAQKSLSLFFRKRYGDALEYPMFPSLDYSEFRSLVLRNSGSDWLRTNMRDGFITTLMQDCDIEMQAFQPVATYINGVYWGMYNMREKINEHFLESKSGIKESDIDYLESRGEANHGSNTDYLALVDFIEEMDLSVAENYEHVSSEIDIENFIVYNVAQIYIDNGDWPGNNRKFWKGGDGKWRWILFDTDFGFGLWKPSDIEYNSLADAMASDGDGWPNPPWATLFLRKLSENMSFKNAFINRYADEMNTNFLPANVHCKIDSIVKVISPEIDQHFERWGPTPVRWEDELDKLRSFTDQRPMHAKNHILQQFNLPAYHELHIDNPNSDAGGVVINDRIAVSVSDWYGDYFETVPIEVTAVPQPGYEFLHWTGASNETSSTISLSMQKDEMLRPHFRMKTSSTETEENASGLVYYPNPVSAELTLKLTDDAKDVEQIDIIDATKKRIRKLTFKSCFNQNHVTTHDVSDLPAGVYFLRVTNRFGGTTLHKLVKL